MRFGGRECSVCIYAEHSLYVNRASGAAVFFEAEFAEAETQISPDLKDAIAVAKANIEKRIL